MTSRHRGRLLAARILAILSVMAFLVPFLPVTTAQAAGINVSAKPTTVAPGGQVNLNISVSNPGGSAGSALIYEAVHDPSGAWVGSNYWYRYLPARGSVEVSAQHTLSSSAMPGAYSVSVTVRGPGVDLRLDRPGVFSVTGGAPPPTATAMPTPTQPAPTPTPTQPAPTPTATATATPPSADPSLGAMEAQFLNLLNGYRASNGLPALQRNSKLDLASQGHSDDMAERGYFSHYTPEGTSPWTRIRAAGYTCQAYMGENIAAGYSSAQAVFNAWKNSPGHNANMLSSNFSEIGIGLTYDAGSPYRYYWTTDFGRCVG